MSYRRPSSGVRGRMKCPVCMEHFDTEAHLPRTLPCQHTVCDECLTEICRNKTTIQCPVDRSSHKVPRNGSFSINLALRNVAEELQKQLLCEEHENQEGGVICINCLVPLCFDCLTNEKHGLHRKETLRNAEPALRDKLCEKRTDDIKKKLKSCKDTLKELVEAENNMACICKNITDILNKWKKEEHSKVMAIKEPVELQITELEKEESLIHASFDEYNPDVPTLLQQLKEQGPIRNTQVSPPHSEYDATSAIGRLKELISEACQRTNKPAGRQFLFTGDTSEELEGLHSRRVPGLASAYGVPPASAYRVPRLRRYSADLPPPPPPEDLHLPPHMLEKPRLSPTPTESNRAASREHNN